MLDRTQMGTGRLALIAAVTVSVIAGGAVAQNTRPRLKNATGGTQSDYKSDRPAGKRNIVQPDKNNDGGRVVAPGGTYSTQPLEPEQDLDRDTSPKETWWEDEDSGLQVLGEEDFDGFTGYSVNDAQLLLDQLTPEQLQAIRVIPAGTVGNPYDIVLVSDVVQTTWTIRVSGPGSHLNGGWGGWNYPYWYGDDGRRPVYVGGYYSTPRFYWAWDHASWWGFPSGWGCYWPPVTYGGDRVYVYPYGSGYGYGYGYGYGGYWGRWPHVYDDYRRYWGPIDGIPSGAYQGVGEMSPGETPLVELTPIERALLLLRAGEIEQGAAELGAHLRDDPEDFGSMRTLGVAKIELGEVSEGIAMIRMAYGSNPLLAEEPIDGYLFGSVDTMRDVLRRVVREANREPTGSAWLAVVVLMQAEGRDDVALKNLAKAEREYLSAEIAGPLRVALGG